ncbi:MAG: DUF2878 domain-containing protein [Desulfomicrobium sp.]|nr:DUF2878 domain-containing protein [Desulfomicrobium sp.]MDP3431219.1 DUF2878 domain-containing protein [Desulfomicrobium sp.]
MSSALFRTRLLNFVLFQAGWFSCVLGAASGRVWLGVGLGLALVLTHLALTLDRSREGRLLAFALVLGLVVDSVHGLTGTLVFFSGSVIPGLTPPWLLVLWMQLASTLRFSLNWLAGRYVLAGVLGACSGAGAYAAGVRLGAAGFGPDYTLALAQIGAGWGLALPLLLFVAQKNHGRGECYRIFS